MTKAARRNPIAPKIHATAIPRATTLCLGLTLAIAAAAGPARADEVTLAMRDAIKARFDPTLLHPETAHWKYELAKPYPLGGTLICGHVNYMNSDRRYLGERPYYTVYLNGKCGEGGIMSTQEEDPTATVAFTVKLLCGNSYTLPQLDR